MNEVGGKICNDVTLRVTRPPAVFTPLTLPPCPPLATAGRSWLSYLWPYLPWCHLLLLLVWAGIPSKAGIPQRSFLSSSLLTSTGFASLVCTGTDLTISRYNSPRETSTCNPLSDATAVIASGEFHQDGPSASQLALKPNWHPNQSPCSVNGRTVPPVTKAGKGMVVIPGPGASEAMSSPPCLPSELLCLNQL